MANNTKNLANAIVATDVGTTATTLQLVAGYGGTMPSVPFYLTCTPAGQLSTTGNSEVVLVIARSTDSLTIQRARKGTAAKDIKAGWVVSNSVYVESSTQVGDIVMTFNTSPGAGRVFMAGQTLNKADYPLLYSHVLSNPGYGTTTSSTFTLKNMSTRVPVGKASSGTFATLAGTGGAETHTLTVDEMPSHNHHHYQWLFNGATGSSGNHYGFGYQGNTGSLSQRTSYTTSGEVQFGNAPTGGGAAHNNLQPYIVVNFEVIAG